MNYNQILSILNNNNNLNREEEQHIRKHFQFAKAQKKEKILTSNKICDKIFFINKGIIRAYFNNDKGKTITRMIISENQFLTNMISFRTLGSNIETFECLEDTEYLYITREEINNLLECSQTFRAKYCEVLELYNATQINHIHFIKNSDVCTKFQYLKNYYPNLINRVNDHILASFIGVTRETFVRYKPNLF